MDDNLLDEAEHEWLQVTDRRWCLCCNAFQSRRSENENWRPNIRARCSMTSDYAARKAQTEPARRG